MVGSGYQRKLLQHSVVAVAVSYAIIVGIHLAPSRALGLPDHGVGLILDRVALIPCVVGPVAGLVVLLLIPERSPRRWCYGVIAVLGFLTPILVPAIGAT